MSDAPDTKEYGPGLGSGEPDPGQGVRAGPERTLRGSNGATSVAVGESGPAGEAWYLMRELLFEQRPCFNAIAAEFGLAPAGVMALRYLRPGESMPMRLLAESLHFDSSNVTGIVDRLEERGLVERRPSDQDRRVKLLVITEAGTELRDRLIARMDEPPPPLADLSPEDQWALRDLLARALER